MIIRNRSHAITVFHFCHHLRGRLGLSGAVLSWAKIKVSPMGSEKIPRNCIHASFVLACMVHLGKVASIHRNEHWHSYSRYMFCVLMWLERWRWILVLTLILYIYTLCIRWYLLIDILSNSFAGRFTRLFEACCVLHPSLSSDLGLGHLLNCSYGMLFWGL